MRFQHKDPAPVLAFLRDMPCTIEALRWDNEAPRGIFSMVGRAAPARAPESGRRVTVHEVEYFAGRGRNSSHAGLVLRYYFHINSTAGPRPLTLLEAVPQVEDQGAPDEFLLAGHPDGGLISISRAPQPFQDGLEPITWWGGP